MKFRFLVLFATILICIFGASLYSVTYSYSFGTGSDSYTTTNSSSTTYLAPPTTPAGAGTFRVRVGNGGGGGFYRDDPGLLSFGAESELRIQAPSTTGSLNINKFSLYDMTLSSTLGRKGYFRTQFRIGSSTGGISNSGTFYFFVGDGISFSDDNVVGTDEALLGMRWVIQGDGSIVTSWMVDNAWTSFTGVTFQQGQTYVMEFVTNNGSGSSQPQYIYNGTEYLCNSPNTDLWVNGVLVGDELANAWTLGRNVPFDSWMYYGEASTGNVANLFIDKMQYANDWGAGFAPEYTEWYSKSTGNLDVLANWGSNQDGSGTAPLNFTTAGNTFFIRNNPSPTIGANWVVSGTSTKVVLGDGTNTCNFTIPSAYTMTGTIHVTNAGILNLQGTTYPTFGTLGVGSTVRYSAAGAQTVFTTTYSNLSIQGTGVKTLNGNVSSLLLTDVGDGTNSVTFTIPAAYTLTSTVNVLNAGILDIANTTLPTLGVLSTGSTVRYSNTSNQSVAGAGYSYLQVYGGGVKTLTGIASAGISTTVGDGTNVVTLSVPAAYGLTGTTNVLAGNTLILTSTTIPTMGTLGTNSVVTYNATAAQNIAAGAYSYLQVYGTGSKVLIGAASAGISTTVGDGTNAVTLTVPAAYALTGTTHIGASSTLILENTTTPSLGTIGSGSYVKYAALGNQNVSGVAYQYLEILGTGTKILIGAASAAFTTPVGDGTNTVTFSIPATYAFTGTVDVLNNAILDIENVTLPTLGTLAAGSTVSYNYAGNQNVTGTTYYTMDVANGFTKTMQNDVTVTNLTFNTAGNLFLNSNNLYLAGKNISFYSTSAVFSALSVSYNDAYVAGAGVGRIWSTSGTFTNTVDVTFTFPYATTPASMFLWFKGDGNVWTKGVSVTPSYNAGIATVTVSGLSTISGGGAKGDMEWTFGEIDETLPVELSSFTAILTAQNYVQLMWVTQSETNVSGFRIFRNTTDDLEAATMLNTFITATNTSQMQVYVYNDEEVSQDGTFYYWLQNLDLDGSSAYYGPTMITVTGIEPVTPPVPITRGIANAYPNPFNPSVTVQYGIVRGGIASIDVFNQRGQLVRNLHNGFKESGNYSVVWNGLDNAGRELPSGVYNIRLVTDGKAYGHKVIFLK